MNKSYIYRTTKIKVFDPNVCISGIIYIFLFYHVKFISKYCKNIFFYQKFVHLGKHTSIFCSQIFCKCFFCKVLTAIHNITNGIKPGSNSKTTDQHTVDCRFILRRKAFYVRCINCSYNNMAKGFPLIDKKNQEKIHTSKSF